MGYNNGYESGYSDALEDVRSGKVAGLGSTSGADKGTKRYSMVAVEDPESAEGISWPDADTLRVSLADLGYDPEDPGVPVLDFGRIADKLAPVIVIAIRWEVSHPTVGIIGPEGYDWSYLADTVSPGGASLLVLSVDGGTYIR